MSGWLQLVGTAVLCVLVASCVASAAVLTAAIVAWFSEARANRRARAENLRRARASHPSQAMSRPNLRVIEGGAPQLVEATDRSRERVAARVSSRVR
jgi:hypothetical protein